MTVAQKWQSEQKGKIASRDFSFVEITEKSVGSTVCLASSNGDNFFGGLENPASVIKKSCVLFNSTTLKIGIDLGYKVDITQRVTRLKVYYKGPAKSGQHVVNEVVNDSCIPGLVGSVSSYQVLVLYYHDPTHNNELESEDKGQQQHNEDVGNEDEYEEEEEEEEKEDVIVDSDYELSEEEENGNKEAASKAQPRNNAPNVEYAQCFEEMNEMPLNETGEILDDDEDSDRLPYDGDSSGDEEDGKKKGKQEEMEEDKF
ncbi:unnamed protein product [Prunus armeniaca]|uniref:Uncharacterized protein n=1 Tax=Prunus armeniaca TaxID=36596 RepID=A0A6J5TJA5_PRUAR|nr:unnamed protein product [Prunus armeniaca]